MQHGPVIDLASRRNAGLASPKLPSRVAAGHDESYAYIESLRRTDPRTRRFGGSRRKGGPPIHRLSAHFTLEELCKSAVAARHGIDNRPNLEALAGRRILAALEGLCAHVLEPVRGHFAAPFRPSSGYRCLALNRLIGSRDSSQHLLGQAADFEVPGVDNAELAAWIRGNLDYDQLILEYYTPSVPASGWVHCSYVGAANRRQALTVTPRHRLAGLVA